MKIKWGAHILILLLAACGEPPASTPFSPPRDTVVDASPKPVLDTVKKVIPTVSVIDSSLIQELKKKNRMVDSLLKKERAYLILTKSLSDRVKDLSLSIGEQNKEMRDMQTSYDSLLGNTSILISKQEYELSVYKEKFGEIPKQP